MTLLVGIRSKLGIVIAADRQASHGAFGQPTVGQPTTKVRVIGGNVLFASSGAVGLGQQLAYVVESDATQFSSRKYHSVTPLLQKKFREHIEPAFQTARHAAGIIGNAAQADAICGCLLAANFKDGMHISEISPQGGMECLSDDIPFVCLGSGKQNADPFLRYIWSVYFRFVEPTLSEASLVAYWTVKTAIDLKSPGVGFDTDVFLLESINNVICGRQIRSEELQEHDDFIKNAEDALRSIRERMSGTEGHTSEPPIGPRVCHRLIQSKAAASERTPMKLAAVFS